MYYKSVTSEGVGSHQHNYVYDMPKKGKGPGKWATPFIKSPKVCVRGYHVSSLYGLNKWYSLYRGERLYVVNVTGKSSRKRDKIAFSSIQLVEELFITERRVKRFVNFCNRKFNLNYKYYRSGGELKNISYLASAFNNKQLAIANMMFVEIMTGRI
jgi:hypothetical protein